MYASSVGAQVKAYPELYRAPLLPNSPKDGKFRRWLSAIRIAEPRDAKMPVNPSSSNEARQENIKAEIATKKYPLNQAIAIGYSEQRQAKKRERRAETTRKSKRR